MANKRASATRKKATKVARKTGKSVKKAASKKKAAKPAKRVTKKVKKAVKKVKKVVKKAVRKAARKAVKKSAGTARKKTVAKAARTLKKKAVRKAVKATGKVKATSKKTTRKATKKAVKAQKPARKPPRRVVKQRPPVIPTLPAAPPPPVTEPLEDEDRGPRFFEPDDLPTAARPAGEGPFFEDDRRDRPFYDTEVRHEGQFGHAEPDDVVGGHFDDAFDVDDDDDEEDDDDDNASATQPRPPPGAVDRAASTARHETGLEVGSPAPGFELADENGEVCSLAANRGSIVVLCFCPKGVDSEFARDACGLRDALGEFDDRNAVVFGVSPNSVDGHAAFVHKYSLTFPLLADEDCAVAREYRAYDDAGGTPRVKPVTVVIDETGQIAGVLGREGSEDHPRRLLRWLDQNRLAGG